MLLKDESGFVQQQHGVVPVPKQLQTGCQKQLFIGWFRAYLNRSAPQETWLGGGFSGLTCGAAGVRCEISQCPIVRECCRANFNQLAYIIFKERFVCLIMNDQDYDCEKEWFSLTVIFSPGVIKVGSAVCFRSFGAGPKQCLARSGRMNELSTSINSSVLTCIKQGMVYNALRGLVKWENKKQLPKMSVVTKAEEKVYPF